MPGIDRRLLVCYIPGLDKRRVSSEVTPTIAKMLRDYSSVEIQTLPNTELVPTLLSGVFPHQNRVWQVSCDPKTNRTALQRSVDILPDILTTTFQCIRQRFDADFDLAAIPPWRRRQFNQHRFKYTRRAAAPESLAEFNGYQTIFGALERNARYRFTHRFETLGSIATEILASALKLEFLEMYALDLFQHWHLDDAEQMSAALRQTDDFVACLLDGCHRTGQTLVLLSDHGQELVTHSIPLLSTLRKTDVPRMSYSFYCELACARFWFHTDLARKALLSTLGKIHNCRLLHFTELHEFDVSFDDASYGEYYLMADAGSIFFPHDFYQPLANLYLGVFGPSQRIRISNPVHRGNHGYLPHYPSEKGFLVIADREMRPTRDQMSLIDFAPTILNCVGVAKPLHMAGHSVL